jgi:excisionase family DNA binding protein
MSNILETQAPAALALSPRDAATAANIGPTKLYAEIKSGRLKARKIGRRTIILRDDLLAYLHSLPVREAA